MLRQGNAQAALKRRGITDLRRSCDAKESDGKDSRVAVGLLVLVWDDPQVL